MQVSGGGGGCGGGGSVGGVGGVGAVVGGVGVGVGVVVGVVVVFDKAGTVEWRSLSFARAAGLFQPTQCRSTQSPELRSSSTFVPPWAKTFAGTRCGFGCNPMYPAQMPETGFHKCLVTKEQVTNDAYMYTM